VEAYSLAASGPSGIPDSLGREQSLTLEGSSFRLRSLIGNDPDDAKSFGGQVLLPRITPDDVRL